MKAIFGDGVAIALCFACVCEGFLIYRLADDGATTSEKLRRAEQFDLPRAKQDLADLKTKAFACEAREFETRNSLQSSFDNCQGIGDTMTCFAKSANGEPVRYKCDLNGGCHLECGAVQ